MKTYISDFSNGFISEFSSLHDDQITLRPLEPVQPHFYRRMVLDSVKWDPEITFLISTE